MLRDESGKRIRIRPLNDGFEIEHMGKSTVLYRDKESNHKILIGDGTPILRWKQFELLIV